MRTVFILDPAMKVRWRWITRPEQRLPDLSEILAEAKKVTSGGAATKKRTASPPKIGARGGKKAG